jgi:hypothetical protein
VFGAVASLVDLPALVDDLREQLNVGALQGSSAA